ncbi:hypothetical protein SNEBB_007272 [Seison nebaliae]|nr:hypothetical protein SNEBB_007272 [Seison nebaliae]
MMDISELILQDLQEHLESIESDSDKDSDNGHKKSTSSRVQDDSNNEYHINHSCNTHCETSALNQRKYDKSEKIISNTIYPASTDIMPRYDRNSNKIVNHNTDYTGNTRCRTDTSIPPTSDINNHNVVNNHHNAVIYNQCRIQTHHDDHNTMNKCHSLENLEDNNNDTNIWSLWNNSIIERNFYRFTNDTIKTKWPCTLIETIILLDMDNDLRKHVNSNIDLFHQIIYIINKFLKNIPNKHQYDENYLSSTTNKSQDKHKKSNLALIIEQTSSILGQQETTNENWDWNDIRHSKNGKILAFIIIHVFFYDNQNDEIFRHRIWPKHIIEWEHGTKDKPIKIKQYLAKILNHTDNIESIPEDSWTHLKDSIEIFKLIRAQIFLKNQTYKIQKEIERTAMPMNLWNKDEYNHKQLLDNFKYMILNKQKHIKATNIIDNYKNPDYTRVINNYMMTSIKSIMRKNIGQEIQIFDRESIAEICEAYIMSKKMYNHTYNIPNDMHTEKEITIKSSRHMMKIKQSLEKIKNINELRHNKVFNKRKQFIELPKSISENTRTKNKRKFNPDDEDNDYILIDNGKSSGSKKKRSGPIQSSKKRKQSPKQLISTRDNGNNNKKQKTVNLSTTPSIQNSRESYEQTVSSSLDSRIPHLPSHDLQLTTPRHSSGRQSTINRSGNRYMRGRTTNRVTMNRQSATNFENSNDNYSPMSRQRSTLSTAQRSRSYNHSHNRRRTTHRGRHHGAS